ncbi:MAG: hypothetical protein GF409_05245 [Candidatus Omnitrophica bacterium]|nr:hypothetical protein [Candidatus Omnitrophota bacterium]
MFLMEVGPVKKLITFMFIAAFVSCSVPLVCFSSSVVEVVSVDGDVKVVPSNTVKSVHCRVGMELAEGTRIVTDAGSSVKLSFDPHRKNIIRIMGKSDVVLKLTNGDKVELIDGEVYAMIKELKRGEKFRIRTPDAVCGARGTGWRTKKRGGVSEVAVFDGRVYVRGLTRDGSVMDGVSWVSRGEKVKVKKGSKPGEKEKLTPEELALMEQQAGLAKQKKKERVKGLGVANGKREEHRKNIIERKTESLRREKDRPTGRTGGGSELKKVREVRP